MARSPLWQPEVPAKPGPDPLPWLTEMWEGEAFPERPVTDPARLTAALSCAQRALDSFVAGLSSSEQSYRLTLGKATVAPAGTVYSEHVVFVGTKPWTHYLDGSLTEGQLAAVFTGLAYHEVGHIRYDEQEAQATLDWLNATYGGEHSPVWEIGRGCMNVARDLRLEARMQQDFPGFAEALRVAMWWVSTRSNPSVMDTIDPSTIGGRYKAFMDGSRYPWEAVWVGHEGLRDTWRDWAARCEDAETLSDFQSLVSEAVERILDGADPTGPAPKSEQPSGPKGPGEPKPSGEGSDEPQTTTSGGGEQGEDESEDDETTEGRGGDPDDETVTEGDGEGDEGDDDGDEPTADEPEPEPLSDGTESLPTFGGSQPDFGDDDDESDATEGGEPDDDGDSAEGDEPGDATEGGVSDDDPDDGGTIDDEREAKVERGIAEDSPSDWNEGDIEVIQSASPKGCASKMAEDPDDLARQANVTVMASSQKTNRRRTFTYTANGVERNRTIVEVRLSKHASEVYGDVKPAGDHFETTLPATLQGGRRSGGSYSRGFKRTKDDRQASMMLAAVMSSSRKGPGAPEYGQRTGRIDRRRVGRLAYGEGRVFQRPEAAAPQRVAVSILIDASGSMQWGESGPNIEKAAQVGRNLAQAIESLTWTRGVVAAHTTASVGSEHLPVFIPIWQSGEPVEYLDDVLTISHNGNEDGFAIAFAAEELLGSLARDEKGLLIVVSDGAPAYSDGESHTRETVDAFRKRGLRVVSVSLTEALRVETQEHMFGSTDIVPYNANPSAFAQSMARVIGSSI